LISATILGIAIADHYGISWDEISEREYGWVALQAYRGIDVQWGDYDLRKYYGPLYLMVSNLVSRWISGLQLGWTQYEAGHFVNFMVYVLGLIPFYWITKQVVSASSALITTAFFATQPLLFGHAFINHKDIPFMVLFGASMALGLAAYERIKAYEARSDNDDTPPIGVRDIVRGFGVDWKHTGFLERAALFVVLLLCAFVMVDLFILHRLILPGLREIIINASHADAFPLVRWLASLFAPGLSQNSLEGYLLKLELYRPVIQVAFTAMSILPLAIALISISPTLRRECWGIRLKGSLRFWRRTRAFHLLLASAAISGLASSIRPLGFLAFLLIGMLILATVRKPSSFPLFVGGLLLAVIMISTWPAMWKLPWKHLIESLELASNHPWRGEILYRGDIFIGGTLPWHYLPTLLMLQFTEPTYLLIFAGILFLWRDRGIAHNRAILLVLAAWFLLPFGAAIVGGAVLLDNFRQFLFALPALFIFSGIGIEKLRRLSSSRWYQVVIVSLLILPGFISIFRLHPYEYIYYNSFAGGVRGAFRSYELDYWCTSYKAAFEAINPQLKEGSNLAVWGADRTAEHYAREDVNVTKVGKEDIQSLEGFDYVLLPTRSNIDRVISEPWSEAWRIRSLEIPLAIVFTR
jgi:4-amino-4-deoxy-L-arabinose transferase-like glycosyltransferase